MANRSVAPHNEKSTVLPRMLLLEGLAARSDANDLPDVSPLLKRVRNFLPQMAAANEALTKEQCSSSGIDIINIQDDSCSGESSDESNTKEESVDRQRVEIDVSIFRDDSVESSELSSDSSDCSEADDELPEAFRINSESQTNASNKRRTCKRKLIEEVEQRPPLNGS